MKSADPTRTPIRPSRQEGDPVNLLLGWRRVPIGVSYGREQGATGAST
jgi:hypothetical protein